MRHDDRTDAPGAPGFRLQTVTAFVAVDESDDSEGIISFWDALQGAHMPMIGADQARIESLKPIAQEVARATGQPVKLVRFSVREDVEEYT